MALAFLQLLRPQTIPDQHTLQVYRAQVESISARVQGIFDEWINVREIEPDYARLANVASVNRWALMRLATQTQTETEPVQPPRAVSHVYRDLLSAVTASARAFQLLANGYRFHKSQAICDGQAMLVDSVSSLPGLVNQVAVTR